MPARAIIGLWSKKIDNDETAILTALGEICDLADKVHWAVDISGMFSRVPVFASAFTFVFVFVFVMLPSPRFADFV